MYYEETFASMDNMAIIHTLIYDSLVLHKHISQIDVKNALLNADMHKEVYMVPSPDFFHN